MLWCFAIGGVGVCWRGRGMGRRTYFGAHVWQYGGEFGRWIEVKWLFVRRRVAERRERQTYQRAEQREKKKELDLNYDPPKRVQARKLHFWRLITPVTQGRMSVQSPRLHAYDEGRWEVWWNLCPLFDLSALAVGGVADCNHSKWRSRSMI